MNNSRITRNLHITYCNDVKTTEVKHKTLSWLEISALLTKKPTVTIDRSSLAWPLFVPFKMTAIEDGAVTKDYGTGPIYSRCNANVEHMDLLVIDVDNCPAHQETRGYMSFEDAKAIFSKYACVFYTSYNHRNPNKHNVDKFRVVLPLAESVALDDVKDRKEGLVKLFPFADAASFTASQPFYVPIVNPERADMHMVWESDSHEWFDLFSVKATVKETFAPVKVTGEVFASAETLTIRTTAHGTLTAAELFSRMEEGYANRINCYKLSNPHGDRKPTAYIFKTETGLKYKGTGDADQFIRVLKTERLEDDDTPAFLPKIGKATKRVALPPAKPVEPAAVKPKQILDWSNPTVDEMLTATERAIQDPDSPVINMLARYLPEGLVGVLPDEGVIAIRSPKGTGKTELLKNMSTLMEKEGKRHILLGHRVHLLRNLSTRLVLINYQDVEEADGLSDTDALAVCINSLIRIEPRKSEPYHTIIIDESEQVLAGLVAKTLKNQISQVFNTLVWLIRKAKRIIVLDADMTGALTIELIKELRGSVSGTAFGINNLYKIGASKTTKMYLDKQHALHDAFADLAAGEKVFVATNNAKLCHTLGNIAESMGIKSLVVTADTQGEPETAAFTANPTTEQTKYQAVFASPTLSTGVSIDGNHFTRVYGIFGLNNGTFQDADQAISRVRHCDDVRVWIGANKEEKVLRGSQYFYEEELERERGSRKVHPEEEQFTQGQLSWARIYADIKSHIERSSYMKDVQFAELRREHGFNIETVDVDDVCKKAMADLLAEFRYTGEDRALGIFNARRLHPEEALELGRKRNLDDADYLALQRFKIKEALMPNATTEELESNDPTIDDFRAALKENLLGQIAKFKNLRRSSVDELVSRDLASRKMNKDVFTNNTHHVQRKLLIDELVKVARIVPENIVEACQRGESVEISVSQLNAVADAYVAGQRNFNFYFNARIKDPTLNAAKVWNATLGDGLALFIKTKRVRTKEFEGMRYFINAEKTTLTHLHLAATQ